MMLFIQINPKGPGVGAAIQKLSFEHINFDSCEISNRGT